MPLVEIPSIWLLVYPCGKHVDGWYVGVRPDGSIGAATAEDAWKKLTTSVKELRELKAEGWTVRGLGADESVTPSLCDCSGVSA